MEKTMREVDQTTTRSGNTVHKNTRIIGDNRSSISGANLIEQIIWTIAAIITVLLALRFIFVLFGANPSNGFANFIYNTSHPLVSPFFSLFNYHVYIKGTSRFEGYTLVAMVIYLLFAWLLTRLVSLGKYRE